MCAVHVSTSASHVCRVYSFSSRTLYFLKRHCAMAEGSACSICFETDEDSIGQKEALSCSCVFHSVCLQGYEDAMGSKYESGNVKCPKCRLTKDEVSSKEEHVNDKNSASNGMVGGDPVPVGKSEGDKTAQSQPKDGTTVESVKEPVVTCETLEDIVANMPVTVRCIHCNRDG